jgi:hypothetical protein
MTKYNTQKLSDSLVEHRVSGTNWIIEEWIKDKMFTVYNKHADLNDLFYIEMPEQYKTRRAALDAIKEFLVNEDFFVENINSAKEIIKMYKKAWFA